MIKMNLERAIQKANRLLPGKAAPNGKRDPRWQAIIAVGGFIDSNPLPVWEFAAKWGRHPNADVRSAISTCLLEHLLEYHFDVIFPRVQEAVQTSKRFRATLGDCWRLGQAKTPKNTKRLDRLTRKSRKTIR